MTPARNPKPGWAYRTGSEGGNSGARNSCCFGFSTTSHTKHFSKRVFEESFSRKCSWGAYATFTEGFPIIFHEGQCSSWNRLFSYWFMCRFRTRSRMFAFGWLASTWEWLERTLDALGLCFGSVISWFHGMIWRYDLIILWYDHVILWYDHEILYMIMSSCDMVMQYCDMIMQYCDVII